MEFKKMFDYEEPEEVNIVEGYKTYERKEVLGGDITESVYLHDDDGSIISEFFMVNNSSEAIETHRIVIDERTCIEVNIGGMQDEIVMLKDGIAILRHNISRSREIMNDFTKRIKAGEVK